MSRRIVNEFTRRQTYICARCALRQKFASLPSRRAFHNATYTARLEKQGDSSFLGLLEERGYVNQVAGDRNALERLLQSKGVGIYAGIDPTAPSLHLGHLLPLMVLFWALVHGHNVTSLVGGGTARVGDPAGRLTSREKTDTNVQTANFESMFGQTTGLWENAVRYAQRHGYRLTDMGKHQLLDNARWLGKLNILDFLKTLGNGMRVGAMLGRDTVRNKIQHGDGMSFSELTYPLLQAWDWWHMYRRHDVRLQVGGSDQYGNIIAGMDAVKYIAQNWQYDANASEEMPRWLDKEGRLRAECMPMGLTVPLLTTASGEKFGKSAGNAVWLDSGMTSPFDLYGFLLRSSDADVERYLKLFTFVSIPDITNLISQHNADPGKRLAQHTLAWEVLFLVHGREVANKAQGEHQVMRNPNLLVSYAKSGSADEAESPQQDASEDRSITLPKASVIHQAYSKILHSAGLAESRSQAVRMVGSGAVYVAARSEGKIKFTQVRDKLSTVRQQTLVDGKLLLRLGKWKVRVIEVVEDQVIDPKEDGSAREIDK